MQRVALARALAAERPFLLLTNPFRFDERLRAEMGSLAAAIRERKHTILATHDSREAPEMLDRIVLMKEGVSFSVVPLKSFSGAWRPGKRYFGRKLSEGTAGRKLDCGF